MILAAAVIPLTSYSWLSKLSLYSAKSTAIDPVQKYSSPIISISEFCPCFKFILPSTAHEEGDSYINYHLDYYIINLVKL